MKRLATGVFEGGGVRGIALAGAAAAAIDKGYEFDRLVGTSAGAIVSSLLAAGYDSSELRDAVVGVDWPMLVGHKSGLRKNLAMVRRLGFHSGKRLERVLRGLLGRKGVRHFGDIPHQSLRVVATDLNHGRGIVFPDALSSLGYDPSGFSVAKAVLMSASVPFVFQPVRIIDRVSGEELLMADGAMTARFPAQLVTRDGSAIGFRLRFPTESHHHKTINGPVSLATAVIGAGITAREDLPPVCGPLTQTAKIVVDQDSLDFDVAPARALGLFDVGYSAASRQLESVTADFAPVDKDFVP
jgi:NTE family protein